MTNYNFTVRLELECENPQEEIETLLLNCLPDNVDFRILDFEKRKKKHHRLVLGEYDLNEVLPYVTYEKAYHQYEIEDKIHKVRMNSMRYHTFMKSKKCVVCDLEGTKFLLEKSKNDKNPHFNLYGVENNDLIMLTKDHIIPKSVGGLDSLDNFQTMCTICNGLKSHHSMTLEQVRILRSVYDEKRCLSRRQIYRSIDKKRRELLGI